MIIETTKEPSELNRFFYFKKFMNILHESCVG